MSPHCHESRPRCFALTVSVPHPCVELPRMSFKNKSCRVCTCKRGIKKCLGVADLQAVHLRLEIFVMLYVEDFCASRALQEVGCSILKHVVFFTGTNDAWCYHGY